MIQYRILVGTEMMTDRQINLSHKNTNRIKQADRKMPLLECMHIRMHTQTDNP